MIYNGDWGQGFNPMIHHFKDSQEMTSLLIAEGTEAAMCNVSGRCQIPKHGRLNLHTLVAANDDNNNSLRGVTQALVLPAGQPNSGICNLTIV